ncbi:MAG: tryptophan synthase subunit alpha [Desulfatiglandales bacterium]
MSRIKAAFLKAKGINSPCFIPCIIPCIPDEVFLDMVTLLRDKGAGIVEVGIPFSDPVLDGPVLQKANQLALQNGVNTIKVFGSLKKIRKRFPEVGIVIMSYINPIYTYGIEAFLRDAKEAGADGIIIPDCPFEESRIWIKEALKYGIERIFIVTELTGPRRLKEILKVSSGFLYYTTVKGQVRGIAYP